MSERKNIDRLFQEKFKEFEVPPPPDSWDNIEAKLDGKKKRRIVPFWWKLSGVAAVFLIGFLVSKSIYDTGGTKGNYPVVNLEDSNPKEKTTLEDVHLKQLKETNISVQNAVVTEENNSKSNTQKTENAVKNNVPDNSKNAVATASKEGKSDVMNNSKHAVSTTSDEANNNKVSREKNDKQSSVFSSKSGIAEKTQRHRSLKNKSNTVKEAIPSTETAFEKQQQLAGNSTKNGQGKSNKESDQLLSLKEPNSGLSEKQIAQNADPKAKNNKEIQAAPDTKNINLDALKGTINSKTASKETDKKVNDTAAISVATNELEKLLNEKESKVKKESKINRWQLTSNVAPIFLGSASGGSPIDSTLSKNSKSFNTNVGYGVGVSYAVNKKLSIRTGLNKVNMSYDTNDISFFTGIQSKTLEGVHPTAASKMIHVVSNIQTVSPESETSLLPFESSISNTNTGYLRQEMGYLEMPVEMTYNLLDNRFGLKIIGGFSTLLLQDNSISIVSENRDTLLGEANNLNNLHFSTNLGLGMKYSFYKSFEFNVEPTLKYQLNTFNANAGNFKPYYFGIYSGISYKF